jgi:signal transduction histidine kinase
MTEQPVHPVTALKEIASLSTILRAINQSKDWKSALDEILVNARAVLIYDNLVLYFPEEITGSLDVGYAKAVGRGRLAGADLAWGEVVANQVLANGRSVMQGPATGEAGASRLDQPYLLAIPILSLGKTRGILVFIRFGGPIFSEADQLAAEFIAEMIAPTLEEIELKKRIAVLEAESRQARLQEDFISTISHELLTPLGFIKGYATTLLRSDTAWDETSQHEFLTIIDQETDRLQELIDNLLDSARLQSGTLQMQFQPVRLDALIRDAVMRARTNLKSLQVQLNIQNPVAPVMGDPRRLVQVFENLFSNSIKYAPGAPIIIHIRREKEEMVLEFQDKGPGIPAQYLPNLFERFYRNPEQAINVRGTGLGLYICRQIMEAHQGVIQIDSEVGEGTIVTIRLPCGAKTGQASHMSNPTGS